MRTNCALESYNVALGRRFPKRSNFFRFASLLAEEELMKRCEMHNAVAGRSNPKRNRQRDRDIVIDEAIALLTADKITVDQFLDRLVDEDLSRAIFFESIMEIEDGSDNEDVEVDEEVTKCNGKSSDDTQVNVYILCFENVPDIIFLSC